VIGWEVETPFAELVRLMVDADRELVDRQQLTRSQGA